MGLYNLDKIFKPTSVTVVGASETRGTIGRAVMENLIRGGYEGRIIPVNPKYSKVVGINCFKSLSQVDQGVDLAVIATPISTVPEIVRECVKAGVGGAVIFSAGGREIGDEGRALENEIEKEALKGGLRILGPNCMGIICPKWKLNASFAAHMAPEGKMAFISQSGAICSAMLDLSLKKKMGFRYFVSIGSMLDVDFGDLIDYLGHDPEVTSILLYMESLTEVRKFMSAAREVSRIKPIVVLKAGKSKAGATAAASHTGALAGENRVYEAAFTRAGLARVRNLEDFFDCAELLAKQSPPTGRRLVVVTNSGGPGVMAADAIEESGLELSSLGKKTIERLNEILPLFWSHGNPIDILGDATAQRYAQVTNCCFEAESVDGMLVIVNAQAMTDPTEVAETLSKDLRGKPYPVFAAMMGGLDVEKGRTILNDTGIPTYDTPERAIRSFAVLCNYARNLELLQEIPSRSGDVEKQEAEARALIDRALAGKNKFLEEAESKRLLDYYGIPVNRTEIAESLDAALRLAADMGYPLVMKILSPDIVHKTEARGIQTDLGSEQEVRDAYEQVINAARTYDPDAEIRGVTLQPMVQKADLELLIGAKRDELFGPVILFGMGGIFAEVIGDRNIGLVPLNRTLARRLIEKTKAYKILNGYRNMPEAHMGLIEQLLISLSQLLVDFPEIAELDMNPVLVKDGRPVAVDARVLVRKTLVSAPHHLVIGPYPEQYESKETTTHGLRIFVRPIKPEDAPLLMELFENLSPDSRYLRFFSPMKSLSRDFLVRFTQIDYDRHIGLVALEGEGDEEKMLGVARVIMGPDRKSGEFSVAVGDKWQGHGVGRRLLERCLDAGRDYGVETVRGYVLAENKQMLNLGRELGFEISLDDDDNTCHLTIHL